MEGITARAAARLKNTLEGLPPHEAVRLIPSGDQAVFQVDRARPLDRIFQYEHRTVLVLDPRMTRLAAGTVLDYDDERFCLIAATRQAPAQA